MLGKLKEEIEDAKEEMEYLIFRYGYTHKKVIEQNNKIDSLVVEYYNTLETLKNSNKVIHIDFIAKKVI